jgi:hypothetical protein
MFLSITSCFPPFAANLPAGRQEGGVNPPARRAGTTAFTSFLLRRINPPTADKSAKTTLHCVAQKKLAGKFWSFSKSAIGHTSIWKIGIHARTVFGIAIPSGLCGYRLSFCLDTKGPMP